VYKRQEQRYNRFVRRTDVGGAYCLQNPDGTLADGFERRDMICHYLRRVRGRQWELRSYFSHIRDPRSQQIFPLISKFERQSDTTFVDEHGSQIIFTAGGMTIDQETFIPSAPQS